MNKKKFKPHILLVPIFNLVLQKDVKREIKIGDVIFVAKEKLPKIRKRLGFKRRLSELNRQNPWKENIFEFASSYAVIKRKLADAKDINEPISLIREAVWLLASSQAPSRSYVRYFGLPEHEVNVLNKYVLYDMEEDNYDYFVFRPSSLPLEPFRLGSQWKHIMTNHFFPLGLKIINNKMKVKKTWQNSIKNAMILIGKSIFSSDLSQAFLYNMISIETLLTSRGDKFPEQIINRLNALFYWRFKKDDPKLWENRIKEIYKLRCEAIHDGEIKNIEVEHLLFSDLLLTNLLYNVCNSTKYISRKEDLVKYARETEARNILKIPQKYPFLIRFSTYWPSEIQLERIRKRMSWG